MIWYIQSYCFSLKQAPVPLPFFKGIELICNSIWSHLWYSHCTKKMTFSTKEFFIKCDQIRRKLPIWSHLLKKTLMENFIFCAVSVFMSWKHLKPSICRKHCVYFTTFFAAIDYIYNSGKFEWYLYLRKAIVALLF